LLGYNPYYYRTLRKAIISFGSIFNELVMVERDNTTQEEIKRITVPLSFAGKSNWLVRLLDNPTLAKPVEITLPRMAFEIGSLQYAPNRKQNSFQSNFAQNGQGSSISQQYQGVPYDLRLNLSLYVRNIEDGMQIVEQIMPFFNPDYTVTINYIPEMNLSKNAPITLDGIVYSNDYEGDAQSKERYLIWTLSFTMQLTFYGPINTGGLITQANSNIIYYAESDTSGLPVELQLASNGNSNFQLGETVYQGASLPEVVTNGPYGIVETWDNTNYRLVLSNTVGSFATTANVVGSISDASWGVLSLTNDITLASVIVTPIPANANSSANATGYDVTISEFPKTV
jgi:hypothetical protein